MGNLVEVTKFHPGTVVSAIGARVARLRAS
jgi:hypothetical protein